MRQYRCLRFFAQLIQSFSPSPVQVVMAGPSTTSLGFGLAVSVKAQWQRIQRTSRTTCSTSSAKRTLSTTALRFSASRYSRLADLGWSDWEAYDCVRSGNLTVSKFSCRKFSIKVNLPSSITLTTVICEGTKTKMKVDCMDLGCW